MKPPAEGPLIAINPSVVGLDRSPTLAVHAKSREIVASGRPVYLFGLGQSPFPVPEPVVEALRKNAFQKEYLPVEGLPELRGALCDYLRRRRSAAFAQCNVVIGPGSKELLFLVQLAFDGTILLPTPCWVSYAPQAKLAGRAMRYISTDGRDDYLLDPEALERACRQVAGPKLLFLTSPNNPTGTTYDSGRLARIAAVAREHRLLVISDEIYAELCFRDGCPSMASYYPEGTILLTGLSKWCGAGGWRLGAAAFPSRARSLATAVAAIASETFTSTSAPIQHAALCAFRGGPEIELYLVRARNILRALAAHVVNTLRSAGLSAAQPTGAFYVFPDAGALRSQLAARTIADSRSLCAALLEDAGIACLPGGDFGRPPEELTFRLSLVDFDGARALRAAQTVKDVIDEGFLREHCGRVLAGVDALVRWLPSP